jgi:L-lactate dehydrogenase complex protein LldG
MEKENGLGTFIEVARKVGAEVTCPKTVEEAARYVATRAGGSLLLPRFPGAERLGLEEELRGAGCEVIGGPFGTADAKGAAAGVTGANFAIADTGTLVLESTDETVRLATTLPERHFALLDPRKIVADGLAAVEPLEAFHRSAPRNYLAYISGPSRTADIERVLTIGVHGPRELHILLIEGISDDFLEM